jgi:hypothetical protein
MAHLDANIPFAPLDIAALVVFDTRNFGHSRRPVLEAEA